ncbi:MAG: hypothetical protein KatS3mg059_0954 [Thermomicrobiales bacterium]|nr:MAG: hypothetical protein KatS3mg059_0954 [Thermomicrobiales bacterium]
MRRLILPSMLILSLLSGFALANTWLVLRAPMVIAPGTARHDAATVATVERFYGAVNMALGTGALEPAQALLAPAFRDHAPFPGASPDRAGYLSTLARLHATGAALTLRIEGVSVEGDRAALRLLTSSTTPPGGLPTVTGTMWPATEILGIEDGKVTERWSESADLSALAPFARFSFQLLASGRQDVTLSRVTFASQPSLFPALTSGPQMLIIENGQVHLRLGPGTRSAATIQRAAGSTETLNPGDQAVLEPNDMVLLAPGSFSYAWSDAETPVTALSLAITPPYVERMGNGLDRIARPKTPASPVASRPPTLALGLSVDLPSQPLTISLARVALAPGTQIGAHQVTGAELLALERGQLETSVGDATAYVFKPETGGLTLLENPVLVAGQGLFLDSGTTASYAAAGAEPVTMILVTIQPGAQGDAPFVSIPPASPGPPAHPR